MLRAITSVFSFLTIIPAGSAQIETVARYMYLFPLVGIAIGVIVGAIGFGLGELGVDPLIVGLLVVAVTALVTGIHHTDGLADWADGLMAKGSRSKKLAAMRDVATGSAGIVAIVLYLAGMISTLSLTSGLEIFLALITAEITAKFSMVLAASVGRSASPGSNSAFVSVMKSKTRLGASFAVTLVPILAISGVVGMISLAAAITVSMIVVTISSRSFGGITGDILGAINELGRLSYIMVFVLL